MAYFNHAFSKAFLVKDHNQTTTETSVNLNTVGEFAIIDSGYKIMNAVGVAAHAGGFYLAMASFQTTDTIGNNPGHGGYSESHKSKMILKKYISDMWITTCKDETATVYEVEIKPTAANQSCFPCGSDPILRVDIKGTAALRLLNHNAYQSLSGSLPMLQDGQLHNDGSGTVTHPANGVDMCCITQDSTHVGIAPSIVAINWRDQFNNDPILSTLGTATLEVSASAGSYTGVSDAQENAIYAGGAQGVVDLTSSLTTDGTWQADDYYKVVITLKNSCELQTQFSDCSFDTRDFYLMGGLSVTADLQDEVGQPCVACQGYVIPAEATAFSQRRTSSDTVINDILMGESYRQSPYNQGNRDSSRFREQEGMSGIISAVGRDATSGTCAGAYRVYHLLHHVPRFNNPSGVFDNDQYHYKVYVPCTGGSSSADTTSINADWLSIAIDAGIHKTDGSGIVTSVADLEARGGSY